MRKSFHDLPGFHAIIFIEELCHAEKDLFPDFTDALHRLRDDALPVRSALIALSDASRAQLGAFAETWVRLPVERRRDVSLKLVEIAEEDIQADFNILFRYLLDDEDAQVRANAIDGLWEDEDARLIAPFGGFLRSDTEPRVRAAEADALGRLKNPMDKLKIEQE